MRFRLWFIALFLTIFAVARGQTVAPAAIVAGGGYDRSGNAIIEWTLGELLVETRVMPQFIVTEGVHQPQSKTAKVGTPQPLDPTIAVFPNPTPGLLNVRFSSIPQKDYLIEIVDAQGKVLQRIRHTAPALLSEIDLSGLPPALYFLNLLDTKGTMARSIKVLKSW